MTNPKTQADRLAEAIEEALSIVTSPEADAYEKGKVLRAALAAYRAEQQAMEQKNYDALLAAEAAPLNDKQQSYIRKIEALTSSTPQLGNDELVERLRVLSADNKRTTAYDDQTLDAAITALTQPRCDWVKIDDPIVETWKDGRTVLLSGGHLLGEINIDTDNDEFVSAAFNYKAWYKTHGDAYEVLVIEPTHAMLPIAPPREEQSQDAPIT